jgi:Rad3-related DNA helicase
MRRVTIRPGVYRGEAGFKVSDGRSLVFCPSRAQAEAVRDILKAQLPFDQHVAAMQVALLGAR